MAQDMMERATSLFSGEANIGYVERAASVVGGLALAAVGAQPRPNKWLSLIAVVAGSALAIRGATGHCGVKAMMSPGDGPDRSREA